jgi:hypothetical protein
MMDLIYKYFIPVGDEVFAIGMTVLFFAWATVPKWISESKNEDACLSEQEKTQL